MQWRDLVITVLSPDTPSRPSKRFAIAEGQRIERLALIPYSEFDGAGCLWVCLLHLYHCLGGVESMGACVTAISSESGLANAHGSRFMA